ncbi:MAG: fatty acid desaturase [Solirubrobacterales bacterium]|nr:fatty acid desaturase [Solirubrobacterales bacterium]
MSRAERTANLLGVAVPIVAFVAAIVLLWDEWVGPAELIMLFVGYVITGIGITVGFHRMLTHRAFQTSKPVEYVFAVLGSMAMEGPLDHWVADHRKHHAHTDQEGDPHSPHVGHDGGVKGALQGLLHAHMGWLVTESGSNERALYARDLMDDKGMRLISKNFHLLVTISLAIPFGLGYLIGGDLKSALMGLLWGGLVRIFLLQHLTFSINSICHFFGRRRFATEDRSTNVVWLALPTFGEAWHHNHHAFPRSATHGLRRWELAMDPGAWVIKVMEKLGLVWNVVRISPERQAERTAA